MNENSNSKIKQIVFENFRNLKNTTFFPHPDFNFFYGENAQGKTSILEAIFYLSELRSFRSTDYKNLITHQKSHFFLSSSFKQEGLEYEVRIQASPEKKQIALNGKTPRPFSKLRQILPIVYFTPDSVRLFRVSPSERRDYFDRLFSIFSPSFANNLENYNRTLRQKNLLLERLKENPYGENKWELESWNEQLAQYGTHLYSARLSYTQVLEKELQKAFFKLSNQTWKANLRYEPYLQKLKELDTAEIKSNLLQEMERRHLDELQRGQVLVGPHRDDWIFKVNDFLLKEEGSQGQHRIAVASLKLAEIDALSHFKRGPIALFDDLLSELDAKRSELMMEKLLEHACQVFLTSIKPYGIQTQRFSSSLFKVENGLILKEEESMQVL